MVDETIVPETTADETTPAVAEETLPAEEEVSTWKSIETIIKDIADLPLEDQRELYGFLQKERESTMSEETDEVNNSPEEKARKNDVMWSMF